MEVWLPELSNRQRTWALERQSAPGARRMLGVGRGGSESGNGVQRKGPLSALPSVTPISMPSRSTLSKCCNAPGFLFTTQKNTPIETNLRYEVVSSGFFHINQEIFQMFPKVCPRHGGLGGSQLTMACMIWGQK